MIKKHGLWLIPILCMAILTPFTPSIDLAIARYFYQIGLAKGDNFLSHPFLDFMFNYSVVPAQITAIFAGLFFLISYIFPFLKEWRTPCLLLLLTMIIGAGFIVNTVLKDHWGRPRPRQVIEFGGNQPFRPFYEPNFFHQPEPSKSFPCGHCAMGFYFFSFVVLAMRFRKKGLFIISMVVAIGLGVMIGISRMAQGGHFFSDVLMSALIMWLVALLFDWLLFLDNKAIR